MKWLIGFFLFPALLRADIIETTQIKDAYAHVEEGTLVLIDMDETLIDSVLSFGSGAWRHYMRSQLLKEKYDLTLSFNEHDMWTYAAARFVPVKPVEPAMVEWIAELQRNDIPVFCYTARARNRWYVTPIDEIDELTEQQQQQIGVEFVKTKIPAEFERVEPQYFYHGTFYTKPHKKGDFLVKLFQDTGYIPKKVVTIDDNWEQIKSLEEKLTAAGIPHVCVWYRRAEADRKDFKPLISTLQLRSLFDDGFALSDEEAARQADRLGYDSADEHFHRFRIKYLLFKLRVATVAGEFNEKVLPHQKKSY